MLFVIQAFLFAASALRETTFIRSPAKSRRVAGIVLIVYGLVAYPALGALLGHRFPASPTFGLPCPTTIFTFGLLLWASKSVPRVMLAVPLAWAAIATLAAVALGVREDFGLTVAAVMSAILLLHRNEAAGGARFRRVQTRAVRSPL